MVFWATVCKTVRPFRCLSVCITLVYCGQTVGWIKMKPGMEVGPVGHIVLETQLPLPKGAQPPIFTPCLLWRNGWMDRSATWYEGRRRPRHIVLDGDPAPPPKKKEAHPPIFGPRLLWPNDSPISATARVLVHTSVLHGTKMSLAVPSPDSRPVLLCLSHSRPGTTFHIRHSTSTI